MTELAWLALRRTPPLPPRGGSARARIRPAHKAHPFELAARQRFPDGGPPPCFNMPLPRVMRSPPGVMLPGPDEHSPRRRQTRLGRRVSLAEPAHCRRGRRPPAGVEKRPRLPLESSTGRMARPFSSPAGRPSCARLVREPALSHQRLSVDKPETCLRKRACCCRLVGSSTGDKFG